MRKTFDFDGVRAALRFDVLSFKGFTATDHRNKTGEDKIHGYHEKVENKSKLNKNLLKKKTPAETLMAKRKAAEVALSRETDFEMKSQKCKEKKSLMQ